MNSIEAAKLKLQQKKENSDETTIMSCYRLKKKHDKMLNEIASKTMSSKIFSVSVAIEKLHREIVGNSV